MYKKEREEKKLWFDTGIEKTLKAFEFSNNTMVFPSHETIIK